MLYWECFILIRNDDWFLTYCAILYLAMQIPVDLVIDHSVQVNVTKSENAVQENMDLEFKRNRERFSFLKWGCNAFHNMLVIPPGSGILHQVWCTEMTTTITINQHKY